MKTIFDHIEYVKGKPHHVRRRISLLTAGVGAGLVAVIWLGASLATGAFAISGSSFADSMNGTGTIATTPQPASALAGAAGATAQTNAPAQIQVVDVSSSSPKAQPTVIPF